MGQTGNAIVFVCLYVLLILAGSATFAYAARCFLVILEGTAGGNNEVAWPDETHVDWLFRGGTLAWLLLVWLAPVGAILKVAHPNIYSEQPLLALLLAGLVLWLFFPIGVLSALSSRSRLAFFRWAVLMRLLKIGPTFLGFYLSSLLVIAVPLLVWYIALTRSAAFLIPAGLLGSAALFVYARLLGRVGWALIGLNPPRKKKRRHADEGSALPPLPPPRKGAPAVPATEEGDAYGMAREEGPPPRDGIATAEVEPPVDGPDSYGVVEEEKPAFDAGQLMQPIVRKVARAQARLHKTEPPRSLLLGVWSFPFYEKSRPAWVKLALTGAFAGGVLRLLLAHSL